MTVKNIIDQVEKMFGRLPEQYMLQLVNDALDDIAANKRNNTASSTTDIDITRVEIKDTNDRYVMIPKLVDSHRILREDTESADDSLT